ncbi:hypothetical protein HOY82DRAFT_645801, partial [Tuber indicum]
GFRQNGSTTEANFLPILEIVNFTEGKPLHVQARVSDHVVTANDMPLASGEYVIYCNDPIQVTKEALRSWVPSNSISGREYRFRNEIRTCNRKCVIAGLANTDLEIQVGMCASSEAAHIFPLQYESQWIEKRYASWISDMPGIIGSTKIHSPQNGFLPGSGIHCQFDQYLASINSDDGYKVVAFCDNFGTLDGPILQSRTPSIKRS